MPPSGGGRRLEPVRTLVITLGEGRECKGPRDGPYDGPQDIVAPGKKGEAVCDVGARPVGRGDRTDEAGDRNVHGVGPIGGCPLVPGVIGVVRGPLLQGARWPPRRAGSVRGVTPRGAKKPPGPERRKGRAWTGRRAGCRGRSRSPGAQGALRRSQPAVREGARGMDRCDPFRVRTPRCQDHRPTVPTDSAAMEGGVRSKCPIRGAESGAARGPHPKGIGLGVLTFPE